MTPPLPPLPRLTAGDAAPAFTLNDSTGAPVSLADYAGRNLILFVYPAAATPGCTTEACDFRDSVAVFQAAGYAILGLSPDPLSKLETFDSDHSFGYPLLSDPEKETIKAYGAYGTKKLYGKEHEGILRSTFVIDESGIIAVARYNVRATGHVAMLRKLLDL